MIKPRNLFAGKRVTVMGLGLLGRGLKDTLFLVRCGARVTVTDLKSPEELAPSLKELQGRPVTLKLGGHDPVDFTDTDMILRNADVPRSSPFIRTAVEAGVPVEMDESLFAKHFNGTIVGITGTRGKTTTTSLIHAILQEALPRVFLAGNLVGLAALPLLEEAQDGDTVVMELSSWQLQGFHDARISPHASIFTNVYQDHLNRYSGMEEYIADKKAIYAYQKRDNFCLFNGDQQESMTLSQEAPAGKGFFHVADLPADWKIKMPGFHNRANVAAARSLALRMGVDDALIRRVVEDFPGVPHRLEWLGEKDGVGFVNDTTSTTPVAGRAALEAFDGKGILLIAGGADKRLDPTPFAAAIAERCKAVALLDGTATPGLHRAIVEAGGEDKIIGTFNDLAGAVSALLSRAEPGDVVLLSPGCASFGLFRNEYDRGERFRAVIRPLADTTGPARRN
jgi:UDP-N-acetylmuramoylalanine--D-glutamate ligase